MSIPLLDHFVNHFFLAFKKNADVHSVAVKNQRHRNAKGFARSRNNYYFIVLTLTFFISVIFALMLIVLFYSIEL
jgi:hypothetical protein